MSWSYCSGKVACWAAAAFLFAAGDRVRSGSDQETSRPGKRAGDQRGLRSGSASSGTSADGAAGEPGGQAGPGGGGGDLRADLPADARRRPVPRGRTDRRHRREARQHLADDGRAGPSREDHRRGRPRCLRAVPRELAAGGRGGGQGRRRRCTQGRHPHQRESRHLRRLLPAAGPCRPDRGREEGLPAPAGQRPGSRASRNSYRAG